MGFGDVRLSAVLGLFLGWLGWGYVLGGLFTGFLYGAVIGMVLIAVGGRGRRQHIPFGPFLAAGTMTFVLFGAQIIRLAEQSRSLDASEKTNRRKRPLL